MSVRMLPMEVPIRLGAAAAQAGLCGDAAAAASELWLENRRSYLERYPQSVDVPGAINDPDAFRMEPPQPVSREDLVRLLREYLYQVEHSSAWPSSPSRRLCEALVARVQEGS